MVSPRILRKLSPLLALSLGFLTTTTAQDESSVSSTTVSGSSVRSISYATNSAGSTITSAASSSFSLYTNSAGSISTSYISDNETDIEEATTTSKPRLILTGQPKSSSSSTHLVSISTSMNGTETTTVVPTTTETEEPEPTNTQPCNGWPEFCNRKYSNLTQISAHNSPFVQPNNVAANQDFDTITQLNDGVRMLQVQVHAQNATLYMCHGDCQMLNAGLFTDWLRNVKLWMYQNPYEVVTIVIGNAKYVSATEYVSAYEESGIVDMAYIPPKDPMGRADWPTLGNMILTGKRVVTFMDYEARQSEVPYILDQFIHVWETPFDPVSRDFPCIIDRPPDLTPEAAEPRMYIVNHNLNTELQLLGNSILVPTRPLLHETNAINGTGSLGLAAENCYKKWNRAPNWLLVDYYNVGNGSVFEVAAKWNNVTYEGPCCGFERNAGTTVSVSFAAVAVAAVVGLLLL